MDETDKIILRVVQSRLPIHERPFLILGRELGLAENEVLKRLKLLKEKGIIRRIGGNFNSASLGWASTLCAARVPKDKLAIFIARVNAFPGVTHNYYRRHAYNIWFTFIAKNMKIIEDNLRQLTTETGVKNILTLPARKLFKIHVDFPV